MDEQSNTSLSEAFAAIVEFTEAVELIQAAVDSIDQHAETAKQSLTDHTEQLIATISAKIIAVGNRITTEAMAQITAAVAKIFVVLRAATKGIDSDLDPKRKGY